MEYNDFFNAFSDEAATGDGNQTDQAELDAQEPSDSVESGVEHEAGQTPAAKAPEGDEEQDKEKREETPEKQFTLKVNKEEKTVTRDEVVKLAQKGLDYDRVKERLEAQQSQLERLNELEQKVSEQTDVVRVLEDIAASASLSVPDLLTQFRINRYKQEGLTEDAAKERVAREDVEKKLQAYEQAQNKRKETEQSSQTRAKREIAEFQRKYPDVSLSKEVLDQLSADIVGDKTMTLTEAYQKWQNAEKDKEIRELQEKLAAEQQNKKNRSSSPGSQSDSGSKKTRSEYDNFMAGFKI